MIDPVTVLNSTNTHIPGVALGTLLPNGAGGYSLSVSMDWLYGVLHYALQPMLIMLVVLMMLLIVDIMVRAAMR